jgi:hypothetical protein
MRLKVFIAVSALLLVSCGSSDTSVTTESSPTSDQTSNVTATTKVIAPSTTTPAETTTMVEKVVSTTSTTTQGTLVALEVGIFDWTESNAPEDVLVSVGATFWEPDMEFGGDGPFDFGSFTIGEPGTITIYPDGLGGSEIEVTFVMTGEMISGSDRAVTHIEIYDSEVLVWGEAIPEFEQYFER